MSALRQLKIDEAVCMQVQEAFWAGCIDFMIGGRQGTGMRKLYVQADGSVHLYGGWGDSRAELLQRDVRFCAAAYAAKAAVMRVHPHDMFGTAYLSAAVQQVCSLSSTGFTSGAVLLSPAYAYTKFRDAAGNEYSYALTLLAALCKVLPGTRMLRMPPSGILVFVQHKTAT
jgi:hypothetical protein